MSSEIRSTRFDTVRGTHASEFRFLWLNDAGETIGYRRQTGRLHEDAIELAHYRFPFDAIREAYVNQDALCFQVQSDSAAPVSLIIRPWRLKPNTIKHRIDQWRSRQDAHRLLESEPFASDQDLPIVECPHCQSIVVVSHHSMTPQTYCPHCESLFTAERTDEPNNTAARMIDGCRICERCGLFGPPHELLQFYFYFLYVDYGLHFQRIDGCRVCMKGEAWRMLLLNGPFLIGVPWSVTQLWRTYRSSKRFQAFQGIDRANQCVQRGDLAGALQGYSRIMERIPVCAGLKYNLAKCLESLGRFEEAQAVYQDALLDCANYRPAQEGLERVQQVSTIAKHSSQAESHDAFRR